MIACLLLDPYPLWHAEQRHPGLPVAVIDAGKVRHANRAAVAGGVCAAMPLPAALSRVPDLAHEPLAAPLLAARWEALVEGLVAHSPRVEPLGPGRVLLTLAPDGAARLAAHLHGRVGVAASRELAELAAHAALEGHAKVVAPEAETAFLRALPLRFLRGVGLSPDALRRLHFLGLRDTGQLLRWTRAQQASFLGPEWAALRPYLHGPRGATVAAHRPPAAVTASVAFEAPVHEPGDLGPALRDLAEAAAARLGARSAARLVLRADTPGGALEAAREAKGDPRDPRALERLAALALHDLGPDAFALGLDGLTLRLGGLHLPARQGGLWPAVRESEATRAVQARFPRALVRVEWLGEGQYGFDLHYRWVDFATGEPRPLRLPLPPTVSGDGGAAPIDAAPVQPALFPAPLPDAGSA